MQAATTPHLEFAFPTRASDSQRKEYSAIARYCVTRVEHELGALDAWFVRLGPVEDKYACTIVVHDHGCAIETTSTEVDGALAIWDAVREIEQVLRDVRASRSWRRTVRKTA